MGPNTFTSYMRLMTEISVSSAGDSSPAEVSTQAHVRRTSPHLPTFSPSSESDRCPEIILRGNSRIINEKVQFSPGLLLYLTFDRHDRLNFGDVELQNLDPFLSERLDLGQGTGCGEDAETCAQN